MTVGYHDAQERYHYEQGFAADPRALLQQQAENWARAEAKRRGIPATEKQVKDYASALVQKHLQQQGLPTSVAAGADLLKREGQKQLQKHGGKILKEVGGAEAKKIVDDTLRNMKVPGNIPVVIPKAATPEAVADAAMNAGSQWTENYLKQQTGLPIPVPRNFTAKELERTITGVIPGDAEEAIDLAVSIGIQYASGALASALAGAAIGSAIPGLGTVIGIGMALGYEAFKEALKEPIPPHLKHCTGRQLPCPSVPKLSPIEQLPWIQEQRVTLTRAIAAEQSRSYCGISPMITCDRALSTMGQNSFNVIAGSTGRGSERGYAKSTVKVMGYYEILRTIQLYQKALPLRVATVARGAQKVSVQERSRTVKRWEITRDKGRTGQDIEIVLGWMQRRKAELAQLIATADRMENLSKAQLESLRFTLVPEIAGAARQYAFNPTAGTRQWLATLGAYMRRLEARDQSILQERRVRQQQQTQRFEQRKGDPVAQKKHVLQQLQFQCGQDNAAACREYKRIAAGGALTAAQLKQFGGPAPRPASPAPAPRPAAPKIDHNLFKRCLKIVTDLVAKNPRASKCLSRTDIDKLTRICVLAYKPQPQITPQKALLLMMQYADNACKARGL
jgi:hypothetical protein